jgi:hypothetical protein
MQRSKGAEIDLSICPDKRVSRHFTPGWSATALYSPEVEPDIVLTEP